MIPYTWGLIRAKQIPDKKEGGKSKQRKEFSCFLSPDNEEPNWLSAAISLNPTQDTVLLVKWAWSGASDWKSLTVWYALE